MKDHTNTHQKIQELCDCYATTDPLKEMAGMASGAAENEAGEKWLALAALHGITSNARKITLASDHRGRVTVTAEYRDSELPTPDRTVADQVLAAAGQLTHMEGDRAKMPLSLGVRDSSLMLQVKIKQSKNGRRLSVKFP